MFLFALFSRHLSTIAPSFSIDVALMLSIRSHNFVAQCIVSGEYILVNDNPALYSNSCGEYTSSYVNSNHADIFHLTAKVN